MESWVYVFSKFTQEALLFEALILFIGFAAYAAFYITRRRKYGVAGKDVPSNLVKVYLSQLLGDAEDLRTQLFGLLGKGEAAHRMLVQFSNEGIPASTLPANMPPIPGTGATAAAAPAVAVDPNAGRALKELEAKMQEQAKALDSVLNEKMRLEEELAIAKAESDKGGGAPDTKSKDLSERLKTLEAQLAEYAIIEDDLANLKRLQKENKALRNQLEELTAKGVAAPKSAEAAPAAEAATTGSPAPETTAAPAAETATPADIEAALAAPKEETKAQSPDAPSDVAADLTAATLAENKKTASGEENNADVPNFDALVDDVEKSLAESPAKEETDAAPELSAASTPELKSELPAKSEEELQADFEKMLKG